MDLFVISSRKYWAILLSLAAAQPVLAGSAVDGKIAVEPSSSIWEKPAWITDLSLGIHESYDSNVYLAGADSRFYPATLPSGDLALKNRPSWVTTVSPSLGVDFSKLWNADGALKQLTLGYAPDIVQFHQAPNESYVSHNILTGLNLKEGPVTVKLDNSVKYIDGSHDGLIYPGGSSSFCNSTVRERRDQWQDRTKASVKVDLGQVFVRPVFSMQYYDLNTTFNTTKNYTNYVDRYDINGGTDIGYYLDKTNALTLGYRYGHQYQQTVLTDPTTCTNDYQRILAGYEGTPVKWLKIEAQAGPQFTHYTDDRPYHGGDTTKGQIGEDPVNIYAEASATVSPNNSDAFVLKYKRWNWVSSTGKNIYLDSSVDASYRHQFTEKLQWQLGLKVGNADYNPSSYRNDWLFTTSTGFRYAFTKNLTGDISYSWDQGVDDQVYGNPNPTARNLERHVVSTGLVWAF